MLSDDAKLRTDLRLDDDEVAKTVIRYLIEKDEVKLADFDIHDNDVFAGLSFMTMALTARQDRVLQWSLTVIQSTNDCDHDTKEPDGCDQTP